MGAGVHRSDVYAARRVSGGNDKRVGVVEIDFNLANPAGRDVNIPSRHDGDAEFKFLARDTVPPYMDSHPLLVASKPKLRGHKAPFLVAGQEVSQSTGEITANCAPLAYRNAPAVGDRPNNPQANSSTRA